MNRELVDRKLESLARAVQMCVDVASHILADGSRPIPDTMREQFPTLAEEGVIDPDLAEALARAVGLRNLAVHDYSAPDWIRLHAFLPDALADLRRFAGYLLDHDAT